MSKDAATSSIAIGSGGSNFAPGLDWLQRPLPDELRAECEVMIKYSLASGLRTPPAAVQALQILSGCQQPPGDQSDELKQLTLAHEQLSQLIAPATPRTLMYLRSQRRDASGDS